MPAWVLAQGLAPTDNPVLSLAVAPNAPNELLAGTLNSPRPAGIYRSADGGVTWANTTPDLAPNISLTALTYDPRNARTVYAADGGSGLIFRSTDGGATWTEIPGFRDLISANSAVGELYAVIERGQPVLYAGTRFDGVLRTADGGATWQQLDAGLVGEARRIRALASYDDALYAGTHAGLYRLPAGATVWEEVTGFPNTDIVFSLLATDDALYAGTGSFLYASPDATTWDTCAQRPVYHLLCPGRFGTAAGACHGERPVDGQRRFLAACHGQWCPLQRARLCAGQHLTRARAPSMPARSMPGCCAARTRGRPTLPWMR